MAYIGNIPATSFEAVKKDRFTGLTGTSVTLSHSVSTVQDIVLWINAVKQDYTSYSVNGTALTVGGSLVSSDIVEVAYLGRTFQTVNPSAGSVGTSQLASTSVTSAKLNNDIISGTTALTSEPADTDEFLVSDAGTLKRIDYSLIKGGGITMADQWRITANHTTSGTITSNWERVDNTGWGGIGTGMTESSGVFTFPSTGVYSIRFTCQGSTVDNDNVNGYIQVTVNNADYNNVARANFSATGGEFNASSTEFLFDVTNVTTHKTRMKADSIDSGSAVTGSTSQSETFVTFVRLGDT